MRLIKNTNIFPVQKWNVCVCECVVGINLCMEFLIYYNVYKRTPLEFNSNIQVACKRPWSKIIYIDVLKYIYRENNNKTHWQFIFFPAFLHNYGNNCPRGYDDKNNSKFMIFCKLLVRVFLEINFLWVRYKVHRIHIFEIWARKLTALFKYLK